MNKYYRVLDLPFDAPLSDVRKAYRDLVQVWHPDRFVGNERLQKAATEKLIQINEAYRFLRKHSSEDAEPDDKPPIAHDTIDWSAFASPRRSQLDIKQEQPVYVSASSSMLQKALFIALLIFIGGTSFLVTMLFISPKKSATESTLPPPAVMSVSPVIDQTPQGSTPIPE